jgi:hypothetical protein
MMKKTRQIKLKEATKENKYLHQVLKNRKEKNIHKYYENKIK